jgi:hypothetical protein
VQAVNWFKKAAEHIPDRGGAGVARSSLGFLYMEGLGVRQDYRTAYMYFALSNSKKSVQWTAEKMTSSQIAEAQRRAIEWVQRHSEPQTCAGGIGVKSDLAELLAFIALNNHTDDLMRVVDLDVREHREIWVATIQIGAVYLVKPLSDLRRAKDVAGR